jgi:FOG: TPR repeat
MRRRTILFITLVLVGSALAVARFGRGPSPSPSPLHVDLKPVLEIPQRPRFDQPTTAEASNPVLVAMRDETFDVAEQLVREIPRPDSLCLLGTVHHLYANDDVAVRLWKQCLELDPQFADANHALGMWSLSRGDFVAAEASLREALRIDPAWDEIPLPLDKALQGQGKFHESIDMLEKVVMIRPTDPDVLHRLGMAYEQSGDYENARRSHQQAIDLRPNFTPAYQGLARALRKLKRPEEATIHEQRFQELMAADQRAERGQRVDYGDHQRVSHHLTRTCLTAARVYFKHGRPDSAETPWRRVAELDPTDRECREGLCKVLAAQRRWEAAIQFRRELTKLDPDSTRQLMELGALEYKNQQLDDAAAAFRRVIKLAPGQPDGYAGLAQVQLSSDRNPEEAVQLARQAVALAPTAAHHFILATAQRTRGDVAAARASLEEAIRLDPTQVLYREAFARWQLPPQP